MGVRLGLVRVYAGGSRSAQRSGQRTMIAVVSVSDVFTFLREKEGNISPLCFALAFFKRLLRAGTISTCNVGL